jgi:hypothetical protein
MHVSIAQHLGWQPLQPHTHAHIHTHLIAAGGSSSSEPKLPWPDTCVQGGAWGSERVGA